jgi:hypothetical protein
LCSSRLSERGANECEKLGVAGERPLVACGHVSNHSPQLQRVAGGVVAFPDTQHKGLHAVGQPGGV